MDSRPAEPNFNCFPGVQIWVPSALLRPRTQTLQAYLLLAPALVFLVAFTHYPAVATLIDSLYTTPHGAR